LYVKSEMKSNCILRQVSHRENSFIDPSPSKWSQEIKKAWKSGEKEQEALHLEYTNYNDLESTENKLRQTRQHLTYEKWITQNWCPPIELRGLNHDVNENKNLCFNGIFHPLTIIILAHYIRWLWKMQYFVQLCFWNCQV
jgi:hypothetical protein